MSHITNNAEPSVMQLQDIVKTYGKGSAKVAALAGVNITIKTGEFVAIMGRSGSGKSTLMNIIGLLDRHFEGTYTLDGKKVSQLSANDTANIRSKQIGFVFQQFNLLKRTSVLDNILLPATYAPAADDQLRAINIAKSVGLGDRIHNKSNELSGGQIQRVAIARALMMDPAIVLADEPTGNLDSSTAHDVMTLLQTINKQGKTIVLITHEDDIAAYADRTIRLLDGKVSGDSTDNKKVKGVK